MGQCFDASQCLHAGTCCDGSDSAVCTCDPVDAPNYPNDAIIYFVARFRNFSRPNFRVVFGDNESEDTYDMDSDWTWGYVSYEMGGWNGMITAELRDGSVVKETITTYSGSGPVGRVFEFKKTGGKAEVGETVIIMCNMINVGTSDGNFKLQLINSGTGEELGVTGGLLNPGGMMGTAFPVVLPATPQTVNLRFKVILVDDGTELLHDYATMSLDVVKGEGCIYGEEKKKICPDGSVIQTYVCIPPNFVATGNECPGDEDMIKCNQATRALLKHYDTNNNGTISQLELMTAIGDRKAGTITQAELDFVEAAWNAGEDGIEKTCPTTGRTNNIMTYIAIGVVLLGLYWYLR